MSDETKQDPNDSDRRQILAAYLALTTLASLVSGARAIEAGRCQHCGSEDLRQAGRCVYCKKCGNRLGQGRLKRPMRDDDFTPEDMDKIFEQIRK